MAADSKVDAAKGTLSRVSLMTAGLEARGYQMFVDGKTLDTFKGSLGERLKAYLRHSWADRTGAEAGTWRAFEIVGNQLLADFAALKAWMKNSLAEFETLFELAAEAPTEFGASAVFSYTLAWVRTNGTEIPTEATGWRWSDDLGDYALVFEPSAPADAVRPIPSVRVVESFSCDFVDVPAANRGLFSAADIMRASDGIATKPAGSASAARVDDTGHVIPPASTHPVSFAMIKQLQAKFGSNPALLARAIHFHTADDKATFEQIVALVEGEQTNTELAQLRESDKGHKAEAAKVTAAGFAAKDGKTAVDALLAENVALKAKADAHDKAEVALKAAGFEAKDGKSASELALAAHKKATADIATLRAGGSVAVETGAKPSAQPAGSGSATSRLAAKFAAQAAKPTGQS